MLKSNKTIPIILFIILAIFLVGAVKLFILRFEAGDIYPPYSSLRSDPLGTRAFYESLENMKRVSTNRNYQSLSRVICEQGTTFFYLGVRSDEMTFIHEDIFKAFDRFASTGGRLVISFFPQNEKSLKKGKCRHPAANPGKGTDQKKKGTIGRKGERKKEQDRFVSITEHWGLGFGYDKKANYPEGAKRVHGARRKTLPNSISWHTALYFNDLKGPWKVIYTCMGHPVVLERQLGRGTVVLSADSYFLSNEALREERYPGLLFWLQGGNANVVFDESHFGIQKKLGTAGLIRKYGLHLFFVGVLLLAGLFVWKNSVYFIKPIDEDPSMKGTDFISKRDYTEGLVSLLRRNIPQRDILRVCFDEWEKSLVSEKGGRIPDYKMKKVKEVIDAKSPRPLNHVDSIKRYKDICRILSERNRS